MYYILSEDINYMPNNGESDETLVPKGPPGGVVVIGPLKH